MKAMPLPGKKSRQNKEGSEEGKYQNNFTNWLLSLPLLKHVALESAAFPFIGAYLP